MGDPLRGLDDVPWDEVRHAYGPADDTPELLRLVAEGKADESTWSELFASLTHQGTVYDASACAAPFLIALTQTVSGKDLEAILWLLEPIASGSSRSPETSRACIEAAAPGFARYLELLADATPAVRACAAKLVAAYPGPARDARTRFEAVLDAERDAKTARELLEAYVRFAPVDAPDVRRRLDDLVRDPRPAVAAIAALARMRSTAGAPDPEWLTVVVRELAVPTEVLPAVAARDVLRATSGAGREALLDVLVEVSARSDARRAAFVLGEALLWLAFGHRLGGAARKPREFVLVESIELPFPLSSGGGPQKSQEHVPKPLRWRAPGDQPSGIEWTCAPYVRRWDFPRDGYWEKELERGRRAVNIAEPIDRSRLTSPERRALSALSVSDAFWRTDSDLPLVYGLPVDRKKITALL